MGNNWQLMSLKEAGIELLDCMHETPSFTNHGYPYITIPQLKNGLLDLEEVRRISNEDFEEWTKKTKPLGNDVILSRRCNPGESAYVPEGLECVLGQNLVLLRSDGKKVLPEFLRWLIRSPGWWKQVNRFINVGAVFDSLRCADIPNFELLIPPMEEQRGISNILGVLDDKIRLINKMNQTLESIARILFKSWFIKFDPVHAKMVGRKPFGMDEKTAALFSDSFEYSELGMIPKGWTIGIVEDLCESIENGGTPRTNEDQYWDNGSINWFTTGELNDGPLISSKNKITMTGVNNSACKLWKPGTVLIALYASPTVGRLGVLETTGTANQACSALVAKPVYGNQFLYYTLLFARDELNRIAVGAAQQNISQSIIRNHKILLPKSECVEIFNNHVSPLHGLRTRNLEQELTLVCVTRKILPKLMSGEIRIKLQKEVEKV